MAKPLGQVVFKVPELGKQGYELELLQEERQEKREKERDREIYRTGGESAFNDNAYKLKGRYLTEAQDLYKEFEKVGAMFKQTNDPSLLRKANELSNQIKGVVNDFNTQVGVPLKLAAEADTKQWQGYMGSRDNFDKEMESVLADVPHKIINNRMHYLWQGEYLPKEQTPWGSGKPNEYNTVMVRETTDLGKYVVPSYYENGISSLAKNAMSVESLANAVSNQFDYDLENIPTLAADVAVAYAIHAGRLPAKNISVNEMQEVIALYTDPNAPSSEADKNFKKAADDWYRGRLINISANRYAAEYGFDSKSETETKEAPAEAATGEQKSDPAGVGLPIKTDTETKEAPAEAAVEEAPAEAAVEETEGEEKQDLDPAGLGLPVVNPPAPTAEERAEMKKAEEVLNPPAPTAEERAEMEEAERANIQGAREGEEIIDVSNIKEGEVEAPEVKPEMGMNDNFFEFDLGVTDKKTGKRESAKIARTLPDEYYERVRKAEGGISSDPQDESALEAAIKAGGAPSRMVRGEKQIIHTNKGVTWAVFKSFTKELGIGKDEDLQQRFLNLKDSEAMSILEKKYVAKQGLDKFENKFIASLFADNTWGSGALFSFNPNSPSFKDYSDEYKGIYLWLNLNGADVPKKEMKSNKLSEDTVKRIEALYEKNPQKFVDEYFDIRGMVFTRKSPALVARFGDGWYDRSFKLKKVVANADKRVTYNPLDPKYKRNGYRKYIEVDGKQKLHQKNEKGEYVLYTENFFDDYEPFNKEEIK